MVTGSPKQWFALLFLFAAVACASASDIYFAQSAQGSGTGASCANAYAYNDPSNGINTSGMWVAGNTLHVCGTISVPAGRNIVSAQGNGASGNPITVKFESGAILQAPYFGTGSSAGIYLSGHSYITIDGGNTGNATGNSFPTAPALWKGGLIQNYANGSSGRNNCPGTNNAGNGPCTYQQNPTHVIEALNVNNVTIKNLGPCVGAVVTGGAFSNGAPGVDCLRISGSNVLISNNQFVWDGTAIDNDSYGNDTNFEVSGNYFEESGWGVVVAGGSVSATNFRIHDNWFHDFDGWAGTGTHINGVYAFNGSGGGISSLYLYNNAFYGNMGSGGWTSWGHFGNDGAPAGHSWTNGAGLQAWNNVCVTSQPLGNGCFEINGGSGNNLYNNTFIQTHGTSSACAIQGGNGGGSGLSQVVSAKNNVFSGFATYYCWDTGVTSFTASDNIYADRANSGNPPFSWSGTGKTANSLAQWQANCNCDLGSVDSLSSQLADFSAVGITSSGFVGLQWGTNLMTNATGNMATLANGTTLAGTIMPPTRPSGSCSTQGNSGCWDIGAYQMGGSVSSAPQPPTGLAASAN